METKYQVPYIQSQDRLVKFHAQLKEKTVPNRPGGYACVGRILLLLFSLLIGGMGIGCSRQSAAEDAMRSYMQKLYPEAKSIAASCANVDTDGDGYIRCSATYLDAAGNRTAVPIEAECAVGAWFSKNRGCVPLTPKR
jgi:hypothetical protein